MPTLTSPMVPRRSRLRQGATDIGPHAEFVAFGVSQHDPGDIALSYVDTRGPDSDEPVNFGFLVLWSVVQMDSAQTHPLSHAAMG